MLNALLYRKMEMCCMCKLSFPTDGFAHKMHFVWIFFQTLMMNERTGMDRGEEERKDFEDSMPFLSFNAQRGDGRSNMPGSWLLESQTDTGQFPFDTDNSSW